MRFAVFVAAMVASVASSQTDFGPFFAVGGIYFDGQMSDGECRFREVLARRDAVTAFVSMAHSSSPVQQMYGLLGLHLTDRHAFKREFPPFAYHLELDTPPPRLVRTMSGCIIRDEPVEDVAERIARGAYDADFKKPPHEK
jgi:hypothetical protein